MSDGKLKQLIRDAVVEMLETEEITISASVLGHTVVTEVVLWDYKGLGNTIQTQEREIEE